MCTDNPLGFIDEHGFEHSFFIDEDIGLHEHITYKNIIYSIKNESLMM